MMWDQISKHTDINLSLFIEIIEFCIDASFFCFRGKYYHQESGTAMGSPLSPILADIVTENIILRAVRQAGIPPQHIKKYVDDLFLVLHRGRIQEILAMFNEQNETITFTHETEIDGKLPYLDVLVIRGENGNVQTDWYSKPMASGRMLNFLSFHPLGQKLAVAINFIDRVRTLSTVKTEQEKNAVITTILRRNDYPLHLVNRLLRRPQARQREEIESPTTHRSITNVQGLTQQIKRILHNTIPSVGISCTNRNVVKSVYKTAKDPISPMDKCNLVYKINCNECHCCYVGMTTNTLKTRMYGHQTHINKLQRLLDSGVEYDDVHIQDLREKTALMDHCIVHRHRFDVNHPQIMDSTHKAASLPILEMCHIRATPNTVNRRTDTDGLNTTYSFLLSSIQRLQMQKTSRSLPNPNDEHQQTVDEPSSTGENISQINSREGSPTPVVNIERHTGIPA